jgi:hypothetical protein
LALGINIITRMRGAQDIKISGAEQAKVINIYGNTRLKLLKTNAVIWYNKTCRSEHLQPRWRNIIAGNKDLGS